MRTKLLLLNLVLLTLAAWLAWRIRERWLEARVREQKVLGAKVKPEVQPVPPLGRPPQPLASGSYAEVAQKMLFARDRNPNVIIEAEPPKPQPPLPVTHGLMDLGDGPVIILSEKAGGAPRGYMAGEKVGEYTLAAVNYEEIVLEWEGQQIKKKISELQSKEPTPERTAAQERRAQAASAQAAPAAQKTTVSTPASQTGPGQTVGGNFRACIPGDPSPPGSVSGGYRKEVFETPFGKACRWVLVQ